MVKNDSHKLGLVGVGEQDALLISAMLSIYTGKLPRPWELAANGDVHATLYDLSSPEGRLLWQTAQVRPHPIPIAYASEPMPVVPWRLSKPISSSGFVELFQRLTASLQVGADVQATPTVQALPPSAPEEPSPAVNSTGAVRDEVPFRLRLTALAEQHQATDSDAKEIKLIFGGSTGAGKTTALNTISDSPPIHTEARPSDMVRRQKSETTVAMDYGELILTNGKKLRLYGTPGQVRFEFMSEILCKGAMGLVLLANNALDNPMHELTYYLRLHRDFIKKTGAVLAVTHMDRRAAPTLEEYERYLARDKWDIPVLSVDVRNRDQVLRALDTLVSQLERKGKLLP